MLVHYYLFVVDNISLNARISLNYYLEIMLNLLMNLSEYQNINSNQTIICKRNVDITSNILSVSGELSILQYNGGTFPSMLESINHMKLQNRLMLDHINLSGWEVLRGRSCPGHCFCGQLSRTGLCAIWNATCTVIIMRLYGGPPCQSERFETFLGNLRAFCLAQQ